MSLQTEVRSAFSQYTRDYHPYVVEEQVSGGAGKESERVSLPLPGGKRWFELPRERTQTQATISASGEKDWDHAIDQGDFEQMQRLIDRGYSPSQWQFSQLLANRRGYRKEQADAPDAEGRYEVRVILTKKNLPTEIVSMFLESGLEVEPRHLREAISSYCSLDVIFLLMNEANITPTADHLWSAIITCREPLLVSMLIRRGAPVHVGHLQDALTHNHPIETIEFLVNALEMLGGTIPEVVLQDALFSCPARVIRFLIRRGVPAVEQETIDTALRKKRSTEVIQAVLSGGMRVRKASIQLAKAYEHPQETLQILSQAKYPWHKECALGFKEWCGKVFFG